MPGVGKHLEHGGKAAAGLYRRGARMSNPRGS